MQEKGTRKGSISGSDVITIINNHFHHHSHPNHYWPTWKQDAREGHKEQQNQWLQWNQALDLGSSHRSPKMCIPGCDHGHGHGHGHGHCPGHGHKKPCCHNVQPRLDVTKNLAIIMGCQDKTSWTIRMQSCHNVCESLWTKGGRRCECVQDHLTMKLI